MSGYNHEPLERLANTVLSGVPMTNEVVSAIFSALHELKERRFTPAYHMASVKTMVHWRTEETDKKISQIKNWTVPANSGFHDVDDFYRENTHGGT